MKSRIQGSIDVVEQYVGGLRFGFRDVSEVQGDCFCSCFKDLYIIFIGSGGCCQILLFLEGYRGQRQFWGDRVGWGSIWEVGQEEQRELAEYNVLEVRKERQIVIYIEGFRRGGQGCSEYQEFRLILVNDFYLVGGACWRVRVRVVVYLFISLVLQYVNRFLLLVFSLLRVRLLYGSLFIIILFCFGRGIFLDLGLLNVRIIS